MAARAPTAVTGPAPSTSTTMWCNVRQFPRKCSIIRQLHYADMFNTFRNAREAQGDRITRRAALKTLFRTVSR
eukprot:1194846-Prorocentrum_minimum.AAC.8